MSKQTVAAKQIVFQRARVLFKPASEYNRRWRERHPEQWARIQRRSHVRRYNDPVQYARVLKYHRAVQKTVRGYCRVLKALSPCEDCGRRDLSYLMDFDHLTKGKRYQSPQAARSIPEFVREFARCEIVCVRCHRIRTETRRHAA